VAQIGQLTTRIAEHFMQRFFAYVVIKRHLSVSQLLTDVGATGPKRPGSEFQAADGTEYRNAHQI